MSARSIVRKLGPGLLFASSAVGVSHLVQSTRAGADFGLIMGLLILVACFVKYPAFRFGAEYAAATGESIVVAYERQGRWLLAFFLVALAVEGLAAVPAVSLVAAGMTMNLVGLEANEIAVTMAFVIGTSIVLAIGRYRLLESLCKVFVVLFAVFSIVATVAALGLLGDAPALSGPVPLTRANMNFSVAVAGWMPVGMGAAVFMSLWVLAKSEAYGRPITPAEARFDFNLSYIGTVLLALCFLFIGTVVLFGREIDLAANSAGFAAELIALYTESIGQWVGPIIAIAAVAVMFSTVITVIDAFPRVYANVTGRLIGSVRASVGEQRLYLFFMAVQAVVALILLSLLFSSFGVFIDFATTAGFVTAPVIAILNHRVISSASVPDAHRPPAWLKAWSGLGAAVLSIASLSYLYFRFL